MTMGSLDDKVAFISGASRGIGAGLAERFAEVGFRLVLCSRTPPALAASERVIVESLDVRDEKALDALVVRAEERFGAIDLWINNDGALDPIQPIRDVSLEDFREPLALPLGEAVNNGRGARTRLDERVDHLRINYGSAICHPLDSRGQLFDVTDSLLEQVGPAVGSLIEERHRIVRFHILAQNDDTYVWVRLPDLIGRPDSLVRLRRRHADVGNDDIRLVLGNRGDQLVVISTAVHQIDLVTECEHRNDALTHEKAVFCQNDANHHAGTLPGHRTREGSVEQNVSPRPR